MLMNPVPPASIVLFWDYDTQWGADRSRSPGGPKNWGQLEFENTDRLLEILARHEMPSCFAVVGAAALPGERPYHDPQQIRAIHEAGHEIASHSFHHDWLPGLGQQELRRTLQQSKDALEQCIGSEVLAFVPPFNQPFDHAARWSFSYSERRSAGKDRTDLARLCSNLNEIGYRFCRVAYRPLSKRVAEMILGRSLQTPSFLEYIEGIACLRANAGGFGSQAVELLDQCVRCGGTLVIFGHPHSLGVPASPQRFEALEQFLTHVDRQRKLNRVRCLQPRDLVPGAVHA
jgi:peptidoglycan/xylan/chitin deacetylase (PgdA/CDA1 family)